MKKTLKFIVPFLLAALIIASLFWYCFVYDRNFTRDMLLQQARYNSTHNNPEMASWFYDAAYELSGQDENVAIELANQFKAEGNHTKAEYTLSNAIADGGTIELYIALCKTYVEQDKLLDAVNMLDTVGDSAIKSQLDAMRPAAPTSDPAPGFYSQYIPVKLSCETGTLYYTTDGQYPSIDDEPFTDPITLPSGETTIYALSVADNGLVSPLTVMGFTVGGVIEEVVFNDSVIENEVRRLLQREDDKPLYSNELWTITEFTVPDGATIMDELAKLPYLETLVIEKQTFDSVRFLSGLTYLKELTLTDCRFTASDLEVIASIPMLQKLTLAECGLSTISGLEKAQNLTYLNLRNNTVRNLEPITGLVKLQELDLQHNALTSLTALSGMTSLETLNISYNSVSSLAPIATCVKLNWLDASYNSLATLGAVDNLPALSYLSASNNSLTEVDVLSGCGVLKELYIAHNNLTSIAPVSKLAQLEVLDFAYNQVTDLGDWSGESKLRIIDGSHNAVSSLSPLKNTLELTHVYMDYNALTSVAELEKCYKLVMVNVYGNKIEDVDMIMEQDIIVNYDPTVE